MLILAVVRESSFAPRPHDDYQRISRFIIQLDPTSNMLAMLDKYVNPLGEQKECERDNHLYHLGPVILMHLYQFLRDDQESDT